MVLYWRRKDLDAVLFALFKLLDDLPRNSGRYVVLHAVFMALGKQVREGEGQGFTIEVDPCPDKPDAMPPEYQRLVDDIRTRRQEGKG